jgi:uncharacterized repeat protein (TIGR01451 family)
MKYGTSHIVVRGARLILVVMLATLLVGFVILFARRSSASVQAAPIPPPEGYPKLSLSAKLVSQPLAGVGGEILTYTIEIVNTGAYTASGVTLIDPIPPNTTYKDNAVASAGVVSFTNGVLGWTGEVGFDDTVYVTFGVDIDPAFVGVISNTAVIDHDMIPATVMVTAETLVTDKAVLKIEKTSSPDKPGANKPLTFNLKVTNVGQGGNLPLTVTDTVPANTVVSGVVPDGSETDGVVTWNRTVDLDTGESTEFSFTVTVGNVSSGTVLTNQDYQASSPGISTTFGTVYTTTVIDPIFYIAKVTDPDPPGSNREMTYTITVLNMGSLATNLVVTDTLPAGVTYVRGGSFAGGQVSWPPLPQLDTGEYAQFTFTVDVPDIAEVAIVNNTYQVCSAEDVCQSGYPLSSLIKGPTFESELWLDPIAKKPGGGTGPVTPTLVLRNLGPGNALDAMATIYFGRISVSFNDLLQDPPTAGQFSLGPECGENCSAYLWVGDLDVGQVVTITTIDGQSTIGGEEGTHYTTTVVITDQLGTFITEPFTGTVIGHITHFANLIPTKTAPPVAAAGLPMTYTIQVYNSGLSTDELIPPVLTETLPASTTLLSVSDGGEWNTLDSRTVISWTLPAMSPGDRIYRYFSVLLDSDLISGTQIVNRDYRTMWHDVDATTVFSNTGVPVTTTVKEVGLIDSFKTVTPTLVSPGPGQILTFTLHVVNSSPIPLSDVKLYDIFPWQHSTYQRDAVTTTGQVISDIVSLDWQGDVDAFDTELITFSVLVDKDYEGAITNTATITHPGLRAPVTISTEAQVTEKPVLVISKTDSPDPVARGEELLYTIRVENLGQLASALVVTDTVPANTVYVPGSATAGGQLVGDELQWTFPLLALGDVRTFSFAVQVLGGRQIVNEAYGVTCAEGVTAYGEPVYTDVRLRYVFLPLTVRR